MSPWNARSERKLTIDKLVKESAKLTYHKQYVYHIIMKEQKKQTERGFNAVHIHREQNGSPRRCSDRMDRNLHEQNTWMLDALPCRSTRAPHRLPREFWGTRRHRRCWVSEYNKKKGVKIRESYWTLKFTITIMSLGTKSENHFCLFDRQPILNLWAKQNASTNDCWFLRKSKSFFNTVQHFLAD